MKRKDIFKTSAILMMVASISLTGCNDSGSSNKEETTNPSLKVVSQDEKYSSITNLKEKYGVEDKNEIKPIYNVPNDMKFTFKFKSKVDPYKAVTVHTDKACNINSMIDITPGGFSTPDGEEILIVPNSPVLNSSDRIDYSEEANIYGYAPIYYLCIRYDMDSLDVKKLEEPVIIPFTVKGEVKTPTAYPEISTDGQFSIKWNPIEKVDSYRIYEAYVSESDKERINGILRRENGYVGEHLNLIAEVSSSETSFSDFGTGNSNTLVDTNGNVFIQNAFSLNNYYVTAVKDGKESFFSQEVSGWQYNHQLPKKFDEYNGFKRNGNYVIELPETVKVEMVDGSTTDMPINLIKTESPYENLDGDNHYASYNYVIVGTKLKGTINYHSDKKEYPKEVRSNATPNYGLYNITLKIEDIPDPDLPTFNDENYKNKYIDLTKSAKYYKESMTTYSKEALMKRADIEAERILLSGQYQENPFAIDYVDAFGTPIEPVYNSNESYSSKPTSEEMPHESESASNETTAEPEPETEEGSIAEETIAQPDSSNTGNEITATNIIEEQIESTNNQVNEANSEEYKVSGYPSFSTSAEEEYIAENMINRIETFSIKAFPKLQDMNTLQDVIMRVYYQNPYVLGFSNASYNPYTMKVSIEYSMSKEEIETRQREIDREADNIIKKIIHPSMNEDDKVKAIYDYLENNTEYDFEALTAAEENNFQNVDGFEDSFNTYGILCKKKGVCQSYAYTVDLLCKKAGINSIMLTGFMSKTMPHAWNAIEYNGNWYWIDATNNGKSSGIPYLLYQTSSNTAESMDYILDKGFELDNNLSYVVNEDTSKDWYVQSDLIATNETELIDKVSENFNGDTLAVRYTFDFTIDDTFVSNLAKELVVKKIDITNTRFGTSMNYFVILNQ